MRRLTILSAALFCLANLAAAAQAAETIKLTNMHICCAGCTNGIKAAVKGIEGVTVTVDQDAEEATVTGDTKEAALKGVTAIVKAGYHASADGKSLEVEKAPAGKVAKLTVSNAHNCCGACAKAINAAVASVDGAKSECKGKTAEFTVEGNFDAAAVVKALADAGFHVNVK
jgi:periplasmic mercuric ion binding protein